MLNKSRCYLRGRTLLGLFNTVSGCLFNRVLVIARDVKTGKITDFWWDSAEKWPRAEEGIADAQ